MSAHEPLRADPISVEVARTRLEAIVEEMGATMLRTAHSAIFYESRDFSVALLNRDGDLVAMGQYIPHHQGGMQAALKSILHEKDIAKMKSGDIYLTNDAYRGGTHTADINMFTPVFVDGDIVLFCGATAHQIDIGGMVLGAYCVGATSVFQEGIRFPQIKAGEAGEFYDDFLRTFLYNVRLPKQQKGDLSAMLAALKIGVRSAPAVIREHGVEGFRRITRDILDISERRARAEIDRIPDGVYRYTDYIDHDGVNDIVYKIEVALTITGSDVAIDFTGTDAQAGGFINASYPNTLAACYAAFFLFLDPTIPRNSGFFRSIKVFAPEGTLVHPVSPAPIGGSTTECGGRVYDVVIGALSKAWPEKALGTWSMMWLGVFLSGKHPDTGEMFIETLLDGLATGGGRAPTLMGSTQRASPRATCSSPTWKSRKSSFPFASCAARSRLTPAAPASSAAAVRSRLKSNCSQTANSTILGSRFSKAPPQGSNGGGYGSPSEIYRISTDGIVTQFPRKSPAYISKRAIAW